MPKKGAILEAPILVAHYEVTIPGVSALSDFIVLKFDGLDEQLEVADLPDRTRATNGITKAMDGSFDVPMHHTATIAALEALFLSGQGVVVPAYKTMWAVKYRNAEQTVERAYHLVGTFITGRKLPDAEYKNEGEQAVVTFKISVDSILPI